MVLNSENIKVDPPDGFSKECSLGPGTVLAAGIPALLVQLQINRERLQGRGNLRCARHRRCK